MLTLIYPRSCSHWLELKKRAPGWFRLRLWASSILFRIVEKKDILVEPNNNVAASSHFIISGNSCSMALPCGASGWGRLKRALYNPVAGRSIRMRRTHGRRPTASVGDLTNLQVCLQVCSQAQVQVQVQVLTY